MPLPFVPPPRAEGRHRWYQNGAWHKPLDTKVKPFEVLGTDPGWRCPHCGYQRPKISQVAGHMRIHARGL